MSIDKFTRQKDNKSFFINAMNQFEKKEFIAEIKDPKIKLVLWTFGDTKWVMTPLEFMDDFRKVDNPCPKDMKPEKVFLPIEF